MVVTAVAGLSILPLRSVAQAGTTQPLPPVTLADGRLGLCDVLPGTTAAGVPWSRLAWNAGARINRWEFRWDRVEPRSGTWDFTADDAAVQSSEDAGLDILGILIGTPGWGAAHGQRPGNGVPAGLSLSPDDPRNLWATYVRGTVTHYRGEVRTWEVWNEPDLAFFWSGTADEYFQLLRVSYRVIKEVDPSATVMMAGMVVPDLAFVSKVLDDASRDPQTRAYGGYLDAVAWHAYGPASQTYSNITRLRSLMASKGFGSVPVWVTEDGFPASNPNGEPRQAAYVLQTVAYAMAAGASRVLVYRASDDALPKTWGLLAADGQPRMGYVAFQVAATYFARVRAVTYLPGTSVERFALYRGNQRITVLWNQGVADQTVAVPASAPEADLVSWNGVVSHIVAGDGQFQIPLPGASYNAGIDPEGKVVGGPPVFLVEDNSAQSLGAATLVPELRGAHRRLVLLNHADVPAAVRVATTGNSAERQVVQMPPTSLRTVDLDLLAGPGYTGSWSVSSSHPVAFTAASDQTVALGAPPATTWFLPRVSGGVALSNPGSRWVRVDVTWYGQKGRSAPGSPLYVRPRSTMTWTPAPAARQSVVLRAAAPVAITATHSEPVSRLLPTWYVMGTRLSHVALFNPDTARTEVDVRFIGSRTVTGQQVRVAAGRSFSLPTHGAGAVVVTATRPIAVASSGTGERLPQLTYQPSTSTALATAGRSTRISVLNPSDRPAHVSYTLVSQLGAAERQAVIAPAHVVSLSARRPTDTARGVIVRSDVPVVAAPVN